MKTYYEKDDYIKQHRVLSKSRKGACINFANMLNNLYRIKHKEGKITLERTKTKIEQYDSIVEKYWLTQKINELTETKRRRASSGY